MTGEPKLYVVDMAHGRAVLEADSAGIARRRALRRYGTIAKPKVKLATQEDLQNQLSAGAVFFEGDWEVMERDRAFELAGMPAKPDKAPPTKGRFLQTYGQIIAKKMGWAFDSLEVRSLKAVVALALDGKLPFWGGGSPWQDRPTVEAWKASGGKGLVTMQVLRALPD